MNLTPSADSAAPAKYNQSCCIKIVKWYSYLSCRFERRGRSPPERLCAATRPTSTPSAAALPTPSPPRRRGRTPGSGSMSTRPTCRSPAWHGAHGVGTPLPMFPSVRARNAGRIRARIMVRTQARRCGLPNDVTGAASPSLLLRAKCLFFAAKLNEAFNWAAARRAAGDEKVWGISAPCRQEHLRLRAVGPKRQSSAGVRRWPQGRCKAGCARR